MGRDGDIEMTVDAFADIYANYYKPVYNYINSLAKDKALAEDLAQEALIKVLRGLKDVDEGRRLSPWIFRIAHNTCIDYYRKSKAAFESVDYNGCCYSDANCPEHIYLNKEGYHKIKETFSMINQKYRTALMLRVFYELSYREIAARLKLKESTVKTLVRRGRLQFQRVYSEVC